MADPVWLLIGLILLLWLDSLTIAARSGFLHTNHARLLALRDQKDLQINSTSLLLQFLPRLKASLNLVLVLARFFMAGLVLFFITRQFGEVPLPLAMVTLLVSALLLFWAEWAIDRNVSRNPEAWALRLAPYVRVLMFVLSPLLLQPFTWSANNQAQPEMTSTVTEDELKTLVDAGEEEGVFEQGERRMIYSIFRLGETLAREIMVPRIDMLALDVRTPLPAAVDALLNSGHSRAPVFEETVDNTLGLLYAKDLLGAWREGGQGDSLRELLRPAYFVPEAKRLDQLLAEMQQQRIHMAIIVDEYGGVAGLVTLEDIVEEILGEIQDEYDQGEESPYQVVEDGDYVFLGRIDLDDFNEIMGSRLLKEEADTLGGYIYSRIGRVPYIGEEVYKDNLLLTVEQVSARRIRKVRARWLPQQVESVEEAGDDNQ